MNKYSNQSINQSANTKSDIKTKPITNQLTTVHSSSIVMDVMTVKTVIIAVVFDLFLLLDFFSGILIFFFYHFYKFTIL
jgi:hypothetical protein